MAAEQYPKAYLYRQIVQAKLFIDDHFAEKIDLDSISDEACFSKFHFIRLFKGIYGKTPHQYLTAVRMEKATQLLREGQPVSDVCFAVGFESLSAFGSLFKRVAGMAPSVFWEDQRRQKTEITANPLNYVPACFAYQCGWNEK